MSEPDAARATFAAALKLLPVVRNLMRPGGATAAGLGAQGAQTGTAAVPEWKDGGKLVDKVTVKDSKGIPSRLSKHRATTQLAKFTAKVAAADAWLRAIMEPEILRRVPRPEMVMHTRGRMTVCIWPAEAPEPLVLDLFGNRLQISEPAWRFSTEGLAEREEGSDAFAIEIHTDDDALRET